MAKKEAYFNIHEDLASRPDAQTAEILILSGPSAVKHMTMIHRGQLTELRAELTRKMGHSPNITNDQIQAIYMKQRRWFPECN